jgi:CBS domain-containing protein
MGSDGRGEQTVRTDQDNALLLDEDVPSEDLAAFRTSISEALDAFGFPPCTGNVMVRNPIWSQPVESFIRQLKSWVLSRDADAVMSIAIFFDAIAVAGNPACLSRAKDVLVELLRGERALLARFAHLIEAFTTPDLGVLSQIMSSVGVGPNEIDLKRAGTIPIVHGIRALAIDKEVLAPATADRIGLLVEAGALDATFGEELTSALRVFMEFRLRSQLRAMRRQEADQEAILRLAEITASDRDMLRDALRIVRQFREIIRVRFNLAAF